MTRFSLLVASLLPGLFSIIHAKGEENKVTLYSFIDDICSGPPPGGDLNVFLNECYNLPETARSVRPIIDFERQFWICRVNEEQEDCSLLLYSSPDCNDNSQVASSALPEHLSSCINSGPPAAPISSVKFVCVPHPKPADDTYVPIPGGGPLVVTTTRISWAIGKVDEKPTPFAHVITHTNSDPGPPPAPTRPPPNGSTPPVDAPPVDTPTKKGIWMLHPWSLGIICYDCYYPGKSNKFECRSGPKHPVDCGDTPDINNSQTVTATESSTVTIMVPDGSSDFARANFTPHVGNKHGRVRRDSWHKAVIFYHPFNANTVPVCADSEWDHRGQSGFEVRIRDTDKPLDKCTNDPHFQHINLPDPVTATVRMVKTVWVKTLLLSSTVGTTTGMGGPNNSEGPTPVPAHRDL